MGCYSNVVLYTTQTVKDAEAMVYLLLSLRLTVKLADHGIGFCVAISLSARFQK